MSQHHIIIILIIDINIMICVIIITSIIWRLGHFNSFKLILVNIIFKAEQFWRYKYIYNKIQIRKQMTDSMPTSRNVIKDWIVY